MSRVAAGGITAAATGAAPAGGAAAASHPSAAPTHAIEWGYSTHIQTIKGRE